MMKLLEFDYSIEYKKGSLNTVADALSRKEHSPETCMTISTAIPSWIVDVETSYIRDTRCMQLLQDLASIHQHYTMKAGILRYKNRVMIGAASDLKLKLFQFFHASGIGGHSGQRATY